MNTRLSLKSDLKLRPDRENVLFLWLATLATLAHSPWTLTWPRLPACLLCLFGAQTLLYGWFYIDKRLFRAPSGWQRDI